MVVVAVTVRVVLQRYIYIIPGMPLGSVPPSLLVAFGLRVRYPGHSMTAVDVAASAVFAPELLNKTRSIVIRDSLGAG